VSCDTVAVSQHSEKNCWTCNFLCSHCLIKGDSVRLSVPPLVVVRQQLVKDVPAESKNCWSVFSMRSVSYQLKVVY
jgi:hypothetical protein